MATQRPLAGTTALLCAFLLPAAAYLLFWPVPPEPEAWQPPQDHGHVDPFLTNDRLHAAAYIDLDGHSGPDDAALGPDGKLYLSSSDGAILRLDIDTGHLQVFANTGGRPLGIEFDNNGMLLVANAMLGVQRVARNGVVEVLFNSVDGTPLVYPNDIAIDDDG